MTTATSKPSSATIETELVAAETSTPRKKARYSKRWKSANAVEYAWTKGARQTCSALDSAMSDWRKRSRKSALKNKDGALRDAVSNGSHAATIFLQETADVPSTMYRAARRVRGGKKIWGPFRL